jgi:sulfite reductase alpha subunit-like flavoprotein
VSSAGRVGRRRFMGRSYDKYNVAARKLSVRLKQLGSEELCPRGLADEQSPRGLQADVDEWLRAKFWPALAEQLPGVAIDGLTAATPLPPWQTRYVVCADELEPAEAGPHAAFLRRVAPPGTYSTTADKDLFPLPTANGAECSCSTSEMGRAIAGSGGAVCGRVVSNERLTAKSWSQDTRHVVIDIAGNGCGYRAGDSCVVLPRNACHEDELRKLASVLGLEWGRRVRVVTSERDGPKEAIGTDAFWAQLSEGGALRSFAGVARPLHPLTPLPSSLTVAELFTDYLDVLGMPRRTALGQLSWFATDEEERDKLVELAQSGGGNLYYEYIERERRNWIEVLLDFPSCRVPLAHLLELILPLRPREFSVASSLLHTPDLVALCVAVVQYKTPLGRPKQGLCSTYIAECFSPGTEAVLWFRRGRMPPLGTHPSILIGPGTGVAPLRALLLERMTSLPMSVASHGWPRLYFGCRHRDSDFYYEDDWESLLERGALGALRTAFSRDERQADGTKVYVQTRLAEDADVVFRGLTDSGCTLVVCGSATRMPSDVREVLQLILQSRDKLSPREASDYLSRMEQQGRYIVDSWS